MKACGLFQLTDDFTNLRDAAKRANAKGHCSLYIYDSKVPKPMQQYRSWTQLSAPAEEPEAKDWTFGSKSLREMAIVYDGKTFSDSFRVWLEEFSSTAKTRARVFAVLNQDDMEACSKVIATCSKSVELSPVCTGFLFSK